MISTGTVGRYSIRNMKSDDYYSENFFAHSFGESEIDHPDGINVLILDSIVNIAHLVISCLLFHVILCCVNATILVHRVLDLP